jgi:hypothetical protein
MERRGRWGRIRAIRGGYVRQPKKVSLKIRFFEKNQLIFIV